MAFMDSNSMLGRWMLEHANVFGYYDPITGRVSAGAPGGNVNTAERIAAMMRAGEAQGGSSRQEALNALSQGYGEAKTTLQGVLPDIEKTTQEQLKILSQGIESAIATWRETAPKAKEALVAGYEAAKGTIEPSKQAQLAASKQGTLDALAAINDAYTNSMSIIAKNEEFANPKTLFALGFSNIERAFNDYAQQTRGLLQRSGVSPAVLRELGRESLGQLLEAGGNYTADVTKQALEQSNILMGAKTGAEQWAGASKAGILERGAERDIGTERWAGGLLGQYEAEKGKGISDIELGTGKEIAGLQAIGATQQSDVLGAGLGARTGVAGALANLATTKADKQIDIMSSKNEFGLSPTFYGDMAKIVASLQPTNTGFFQGAAAAGLKAQSAYNIAKLQAEVEKQKIAATGGATNA
jgi:hypothetical protein